MPTRMDKERPFDLLSYARRGPGERVQFSKGEIEQIARTVRNSRDVGPRFHGMLVQDFAASRPRISRHVGPRFHGMSVQLVR